MPLILNASYGGNFRHEQLLTDPQTWSVLDYTAGAASSHSADLSLTVTRAGTAHGIVLWFETELCDGIGFSSAPALHKTVYGQLFLPWLEPVPVEHGQNILLGIHANLVGEDYVWQWHTKICAALKKTIRIFQQSTFLGENFAPQLLRSRSGDFVPSLSEQGRADRWLLQAMDGKTPLQQMAQEAAQRFPAIFLRWEGALRRAADLARQFSR